MNRTAAMMLVAGLACAALVGCVGQGSTPPPPESAPVSDEQAYPEAPLLEAVEKCMNDQGWEILIDPSQAGYSGPEMGPELSGQWIQASNACADEVGYFNTQLNTDQRRELFRQEVATHDCIIGLGQPSDPPPSEQVYLDTFGTGEQYYAIGALLAAQLPSGETALECPPPTWFLNVTGLR